MITFCLITSVEGVDRYNTVLLDTVIITEMEDIVCCYSLTFFKFSGRYFLQEFLLILFQAFFLFFDMFNYYLC